MSELVLRKVFFIDDSGDEIFLSRLLFDRHGIDLTVEHFRAMDRFLDMLQGMDPVDARECLIVVDLNLTVGKGTEGLRQLRDLPGGGDLIAGICSGSEDPADAQNAYEAGADYFVGKPLDIHSLRAICDSVEALEMRGNEKTGITLVRTD